MKEKEKQLKNLEYPNLFLHKPDQAVDILAMDEEETRTEKISSGKQSG